MATQINININGFGTHLNGAPRSGSLRDRRVSGYSERVIDTEPVTRWQDEFYTLKPGFSPVGYLHAKRKLKKKKKKNCSNGQVCGFSCISKSKTCTANMTTAQFMEHNKAKRLAAAEKRKAAKAAKTSSIVAVRGKDTERAVKAIPKLTKFGNQLKVDEFDSEVVQRHLNDLVLIPDNVATRMKNTPNVLTEIHIADRGMPDMDSNQLQKGVQPRGWPEGATWDTVPGAYNPNKKSVVAGKGRHGSVSAALHEYGHAVDYTKRYSSSVEFRELHKKRFKKLSPYYRQDGPGGSAGSNETFAEAFAMILKDRPRAKKEFGIKIVGYIDKLLKE